MKTYKLGNKVKCIIRSFSSGYIGDQYMKYENQPYTVLKDIEASLTFTEKTQEARNTFASLLSSMENLQEIKLSNVELTDKVIKLIFPSKKSCAFSRTESLPMENGVVLLRKCPNDINEIAQVFIYNYKGELLAATGQYFLTNGIIDVKDGQFDDYINSKHTALEEEVIVFYSYEKDGHSFYKKEQKEGSINYFILDLLLEGNKDDNDGEQENTSCIHIGKCILKVDKNMYFNRTLNTVDLKFIIVDNLKTTDINDDSESYIVLEK